MQNLNLYQFERKQRTGPQPVQMFAGLLLLLLVCALHAGWQVWQGQQGAQRLKLAETAAQEQELGLQAAQAGFVEPQLDASLPLELSAREAENRQLQQLLGYLQLLDQQGRSGFVAPLQALTDQHPASGLWLNAIHLREGGRHMRLQGRSQDQELLPDYLQRLGQNPVFQGREFARFDVQRGEDQLLHFDLSSQLSDPESANE